MKIEINHFILDEFRCRCCGHVKVAAALIFWLEVFRRAINTPLRINSGYRCAAHNSKVGGAASSRHLVGCAADIGLPLGMSYEVFTDVAKKFFTHEGFEFKTYTSRTYIHVAVSRRELAHWAGQSVEVVI